MVYNFFLQLNNKLICKSKRFSIAPAYLQFLATGLGRIDKQLYTTKLPSDDNRQSIPTVCISQNSNVVYIISLTEISERSCIPSNKTTKYGAILLVLLCQVTWLPGPFRTLIVHINPVGDNFNRD